MHIIIIIIIIVLLFIMCVYCCSRTVLLLFNSWILINSWLCQKAIEKFDLFIKEMKQLKKWFCYWLL